MFTPEEIRTHIARIERERPEKDTDAAEDDELISESPAAAAKRTQQLATIKELLTAPELGTS